MRQKAAIQSFYSSSRKGGVIHTFSGHKLGSTLVTHLTKPSRTSPYRLHALIRAAYIPPISLEQPLCSTRTVLLLFRPASPMNASDAFLRVIR